MFKSFAFYSDGHGTLPEINNCDYFLYCGDIFPDFDYVPRSVDNIFGQKSWFLDKFIPYLKNLPVEKCILVGGNHDYLLERLGENTVNEILHSYLGEKAIYLCNSGCQLGSFKVWGVPTVRNLPQFSFNISSDENEAAILSITPDDINILMTHSPAYGMMDFLPAINSNAGSVAVSALVDRLKKNLLVHQFGHIHEGKGSVSLDGITYINSSCEVIYKSLRTLF